MSRGPDAHTLLVRALNASAIEQGLVVEVPESDWSRWASATFTGARHRLTLTGSRIDAWIAGLPEHDFALRGHLVADLSVTGVYHLGDTVFADIEVLTLEER